MGDPDLKQVVRDWLTEIAGEDSDLGTMEEALGALTPVLEQYAAPGFAFVMRGLPPTPPVTHYEGVAGLADAWGDYAEAFETVRPRLEDVRESEDHLVVLVDQVAVTKHGGVEIHQPSAMVIRFEDDRVAAIELHLDCDEALRTAGLEPG
jgi:ketosteroid isomerase-like protein